MLTKMRSGSPLKKVNLHPKVLLELTASWQPEVIVILRNLWITETNREQGVNFGIKRS